MTLFLLSITISACSNKESRDLRTRMEERCSST